MRIYTFNADGPCRLELDELHIPSGPRIGWTDGLPVEGYWKVGDRLYSQSPDSPGDSWICVAEGSPGTWILSGSSPSLGQGPIAGAYAGSNGSSNFINSQFGGMRFAVTPDPANGSYEMQWNDVAAGTGRSYCVVLTAGSLGGVHVVGISNAYTDGRAVIRCNGVCGVLQPGDFNILIFLTP